MVKPFADYNEPAEAGKGLLAIKGRLDGLSPLEVGLAACGRSSFALGLKPDCLENSSHRVEPLGFVYLVKTYKGVVLV